VTQAVPRQLVQHPGGETEYATGTQYIANVELAMGAKSINQNCRINGQTYVNWPTPTNGRPRSDRSPAASISSTSRMARQPSPIWAYSTTPCR